MLLHQKVLCSVKQNIQVFVLHKFLLAYPFRSGFYHTQITQKLLLVIFLQRETWLEAIQISLIIAQKRQCFEDNLKTGISFHPIKQKVDTITEYANNHFSKNLYAFKYDFAFCTCKNVPIYHGHVLSSIFSSNLCDKRKHMHVCVSVAYCCLRI